METPSPVPGCIDFITRRAALLHLRTPLLKRLPLRSLAIIFLLVLANVLVWAAVGVVLNFHPALVGPAVLAYTLGLRHALDADHISAIDLMTRRLLASGQAPVAVGTFFSLGHSTIVIITSIVVAATAAAVSDRFDAFGRIGGIIGSSVSSAFLLILGLANMYIFYLLCRQMHRMLYPPTEEANDASHDADQPPTFELRGGCLFRVFKRLFKLVDRSWKMYPLGVLFGLGFDTSSEVALLALSSIQAAQGTSIWLILIFSILFTGGMCLIDTTDGALMYALYTSSFTARDPYAILYYNIILTGLTVVVAVVIGLLQLLGLILAVRPDMNGPFWDGVAAAQDAYDIIGGAVCAAFVVVGLSSVLLYKPWRAWIGRCRPETRQPDSQSVVHESVKVSSRDQRRDLESTKLDKKVAETTVEEQHGGDSTGQGSSSTLDPVFAAAKPGWD